MIKKTYPQQEKILIHRLQSQIYNKHIEGEQWYRDSFGWLFLCFNNPLNFKNANSELSLIHLHQKEIAKYIKGYNQLHYGVGVGETELELIRIELDQSDTINLEAVDINGFFLDLFYENLKNKEREYPDKKIIGFLHKNLFQNHKPSLRGPSVHICLGGTFGNFDDKSKELWSIFNRNSKQNDLLLLGVRLNTYFDIDLEKYKNNPYYPSFVLSQIVADEDIDFSRIVWRKDDGGYIRMFYGDMEVFRTRRFSENEIIDEAMNHGFDIICSWVCQYNHAIILVFRKI